MTHLRGISHRLDNASGVNICYRNLLIIIIINVEENEMTLDYILSSNRYPIYLITITLFLYYIKLVINFTAVELHVR